jgi:aspartate carbamoyltransferase catalytic subunit
VEELSELFLLTDDIIKFPDKYKRVCEGKILAALFYEPSTRTRLSFESAMYRLGGNVMGFADPMSSSTAKGETIGDTIRMIGSYAHIAVMRHPVEGAPKAASLYSKIPVINAGDGGHQHPTQTLTDLYTIRSAKKRLDSLTVGFAATLNSGAPSILSSRLWSGMKNIRFFFISPPELRLRPGW